MEEIPKYLQHLETAQQQCDSAWHLLKVTYPSMKEHKILLGIVGNLSDALQSAVEALLDYELQLNLIPKYNLDWESKFNAFKLKSAIRNRIPENYILLIKKLKDLLLLHQKSPMEFKRGSRMVICDGDYAYETLSPEKVENYLKETKEFITLIKNLIHN